jgi:hypothetical protein
MTRRSAPLLAAALALLAAPALARDNAGDAAPTAAEVPTPPAEPSAEPPPAEDATAAPAEAPAAETPAPASPAAGEAVPPLAPVPAAAAATPTAARAIPPSPFAPDQRNGWLAQCRSTFQRAGAVLGGGNGLPDACENQLTEFERNYVPSVDGQPPVIFVRVPVRRAPAASVAPDAVDADVGATGTPEE